MSRIKDEFFMEQIRHEFVICPNCKKEFGCYMTEQEPGFRWDEDMVCPYCHYVVTTSLTWEFSTHEL